MIPCFAARAREHIGWTAMVQPEQGCECNGEAYTLQQALPPLGLPFARWADVLSLPSRRVVSWAPRRTGVALREFRERIPACNSDSGTSHCIAHAEFDVVAVVERQVLHLFEASGAIRRRGMLVCVPRRLQVAPS